MSRTHDRVYHLLVERVRLGTGARRALYATLTALIGSGVWWLAIRHGSGLAGAPTDDLARLAREALALKAHGAAAFAALLALGAMGAHHVRRGWALKRNRGTGSVVVAAFMLLIVSGYALYYLVSDDTHASVSVLHWVSGLALAPMLIAHIVVGRRSRTTASDAGVEPRHRRTGARRPGTE
jgi:hypothetical protein